MPSLDIGIMWCRVRGCTALIAEHMNKGFFKSDRGTAARPSGMVVPLHLTSAASSVLFYLNLEVQAVHHSFRARLVNGYLFLIPL